MFKKTCSRTPVEWRFHPVVIWVGVRPNRDCDLLPIRIVRVATPEQVESGYRPQELAFEREAKCGILDGFAWELEAAEDMHLFLAAVVRSFTERLDIANERIRELTPAARS